MIVLAAKSSKASVGVVEGAVETAFEVKIVNKLQRLKLEGWWTKGSERNKGVVFDVH